MRRTGTRGKAFGKWKPDSLGRNPGTERLAMLPPSTPEPSGPKPSLAGLAEQRPCRSDHVSRLTDYNPFGRTSRMAPLGVRRWAAGSIQGRGREGRPPTAPVGVGPAARGGARHLATGGRGPPPSHTTGEPRSSSGPTSGSVCPWSSCPRWSAPPCSPPWVKSGCRWLCASSWERSASPRRCSPRSRRSSALRNEETSMFWRRTDTRHFAARSNRPAPSARSSVETPRRSWTISGGT
jgi:hypothetical protein